MKRNPLLVTGSLLVAAWMTSGTAMAQSSGTIHPDAGAGPGASKGGSQSERTGESGVPLPKGSPQSGTVDKSSGGSSASSAMGNQRESGSSPTTMSNRGSGSNVKEAQQALKDKGFDPGLVDGVAGARTKEAIKSFQSANNLQATGSLDADTRQKLGVQSGSSASGSSSSGGSMRSRDNTKSGNTTAGKDTDQPNQTPSKNR